MIEVAIGIDIGGTNTAFGIVDQKGQCYVKGSICTGLHNAIEHYIDDLYEAINKAISENKTKFKIRGIGVGAPNGNFFSGNIEFAPNLNWKGLVPLAELLQNRFNLSVILTNDANAAALGEMYFGAAKGMNDFIVITLGTGLGAGIVCNGKLLHGHNGFAGELGHTIVDTTGRKCGCGNKGCLETYVSATGIVRTTIEILKKSKENSILREFTKGKITAKNIFEAAKKKDKIALEAFDFTAKILGQKLADFIAFSNPEAIIFFGGLALSGNLLLKPTKRYMESYLLKVFRNKVKFLNSCLHSDNAAVLGASALVWNH